jgi:membrane protein YdbS with pleckstrin-like domain
MLAPLVIVIVLLVVVCLVIFGSQHRWRDCQWHYQDGTQQGSIQETGHRYSHTQR